MTQVAQITRVFPNGDAQVAVVRQGACAHNCAECGGCSGSQHPTVTALAENQVGAKTGDVVLVETENNKLMGVIAFVYLVPLVFLLGGYLAAQYAGLSDGQSIFTSIVAFAVSVFLVVLLDRRVRKHKTIQFRIVRVYGN